MATLYQILKFVDVVDNQPTDDGYDSLFVPQVSYYTGDVDTHDLAIGSNREIYFVNTLFSCIATTSLPTVSSRCGNQTSLIDWRLKIDAI